MEGRMRGHSERWQATLARVRRWIAYTIPVAPASVAGAVTPDKPTRWLSPVIAGVVGLCAAVAVAELSARRNEAFQPSPSERGRILDAGLPVPGDRIRVRSRFVD